MKHDVGELSPQAPVALATQGTVLWRAHGTRRSVFDRMQTMASTSDTSGKPVHPASAEPEAPPLRLFKYRPINKFTSDIFCRGVLWFSRPDAFNDPCDCLPVFDWETDEDGLRSHLTEGWREDHPTWTGEMIAAAVERAVAKEYPLNKARKSKVESEYRSRLASCGVFSASERDDSVVMWSHYADEHRGICLELDPSTLPPNARFHRVQYSDTRPRVNLIRDRKNANRVAVGTKSAEWDYEREWRLAIETGTVKFPCEVTLPSKMITGVILGYRISPNDRERVMDWCQKLPAPPKVFNASLDQQLFRINRALVSP